ncbi:MAG: type II toxin-antitoxin system PemK/MazF family toxin [Bacteroidota bacterium]|jgi:mRNA interferase MazF
MNTKVSSMKISQYEIWLANLNPSKGTEPGKVRPVVVVQTNLLNDIHLSTLICPVTTNLLPDVKILRVALTKKQLDEKSEILVDQLRAIDNKRFIKKLGKLTKEQATQLKRNLSIVLDL